MTSPTRLTAPQRGLGRTRDEGQAIASNRGSRHAARQRTSGPLEHREEHLSVWRLPLPRKASERLPCPLGIAVRLGGVPNALDSRWVMQPFQRQAAKREQRWALRVSTLRRLCGLTFELRGRQRQDARPRAVKMYTVPLPGAWWPAVGAPLERGVRPHRCQVCRARSSQLA